jgi:16S rRNA (cytosine1402-N4)-methyltransferase
MAIIEHVPVLCEEVLHGLKVVRGSHIIDATVGAAGHASLMLLKSSPDGRLLGLDADPEAVRYAQEVLLPFGSRAVLQIANFQEMKVVAVSQGFEQVDGILMDLGLSSRQLSEPARGFSFTEDGPLDMRLNPSIGEPAEVLVNGLPEAELAKLLWRYGEERYARRVARSIAAARPISTTRELADLIARVIGRREKIHPATRTFQALRIAVNSELEVLARALPQAVSLLRSGGRLAIIAFHSLEDRLVKRYYGQEARDCICPPETPVCICGHQASLRIITRKPVRPSEAEIARNPRSRSARLRIAERVGPTGARFARIP